MNAYKDRVAETGPVKERERARVERGAGDVLMEPRTEEQMADRHAVASGEDEKQHGENRMRDVHMGNRGSETANDEQLDKLRKTIRFDQEAPNTSSSSTMHVSLDYPASGERQDRPEPVPVQNPGHVDDDMQNFCVGCTLRDGWTKVSLHPGSVGLVSRRRCRRSKER